MTKTRKNKPASSADGDNRNSEAAGQVVPTADANTAVAMPTASFQKSPTKQQRLAAVVIRDEGATLDQMITATGWHTTRAALTGLKKKRYVISSDMADGVRTYRAVAPE